MGVYLFSHSQTNASSNTRGELGTATINERANRGTNRSAHSWAVTHTYSSTEFPRAYNPAFIQSIPPALAYPF